MSPTTSTACRRKQRRHRIAPGADAWVEFVHPHPGGQHFRLALVDISLSGLSFRIPPELDALDSGTTLPAATIQLGSCKLAGELTLMHLTEEQGVCGALFYPSTDEDLVRLKSALAGIEAVVVP